MDTQRKPVRTPVALELAAKNLLNRLLHLNTAQRNTSSEPYEIAIASSTAQREQSNNLVAGEPPDSSARDRS